VDFRLEDKEFRGLEQNPDTKSRWAKMAREGKKVMQFLDGGRYVAIVADGKMKTRLNQRAQKPRLPNLDLKKPRAMSPRIPRVECLGENSLTLQLAV
jgi:hypothetical protein